MFRPLEDCRYVSFVALRAASLIAPSTVRAEWLAEWQGELWHARRVYGRHGATQRRRRITAFCAGAFQDATALRVHACSRRIGKWLENGTASRCLLVLGSLCMASLVFILCLPQVRSSMWAATSPASNNLVLVTRDRYLGDSIPTIQFSEYQAWKANDYPFTKRLIYYRTVTRRIRFPDATSATLRVAYASKSMAAVLASETGAGWSSAEQRDPRPQVLLCRRIQRRYFGAGSAIAGRTVEIGGHRVMLLGAATGASWPIPGNMDAIVLETDSSLASLEPDAPGFMLAPGIASSLHRDDREHPYMLASQASGPVVRYECATLGQRRIHPWSLFLLALLLACMALPATTPLSLGDYPVENRAHGTVATLRRRAFLFSKIALVVTTAYLLSSIFAYADLPAGSPEAEYLQLLTGFSGLLFSFRWVIRDHRGRCPTCLRVLSRPAYVGHPSRIFLAWHGTEMLCTSGHGLLYIPEHATSWSSSQRWQPLDPSWAGLFPA